MVNSDVFYLSNDELEVKIQKIGAEICSIKKTDSHAEYIWQADPNIWGSHAPVLFPIIGALKNDEFLFEGETYFLPKHGFIRNNPNLQILEKTGDSLTLGLEYSAESLKQYPFKFKFRITFQLLGKSLKVSHKIENVDDKPMYFSLGGHPAFNTKFSADDRIEDYFLEFDQKMNLQSNLLSNEGLIAEETKLMIVNDKVLKLHDKIFDNDALIFQDITSKKVSLTSLKYGEILSVSYSDFKDLGIWAKPGAPFVCIEPWLGIADLANTDKEFTTKKGINKLMPSQQFNASYSIEIH
jgi:galactose mutarotase-like enzyme